jgi:hypothetical protein
MGSSLLKEEKKSLGRYLGHTLGLKVIPTSDSHVPICAVIHIQCPDRRLGDFVHFGIQQVRRVGQAFRSP